MNLSNMVKLRKKEGANPVIAEIKVYSPKHGDLLRGRDPLDILRIYERSGVAGISYITANEFKGNFDTLRQICNETDLPVLRKDFITSKGEIERTAEVGASAILLITRILGEKTAEFVDYALDHGLDTLVEVHSIEEARIANETNTTMIGINNRDIAILERDDGNVELTERLCRHVRGDVVRVSESGIRSIDDLKRALKCADAALIGTAFMMAENTEEFVRAFVEAGR
ncbi:indole-3-glycerol phosphate synthase TrpC [Thermococcus celer]|uniref:Indole-3-glycerol phosphate synthase n=1 Tax=Thermococcus celer Vu 13 = JCM 8558 TaxID=1293037 RepID=A0A218P1V9_THECE|nr:indole-3-glycerol phosphate synthase TrpC [Thermococcus celer]ASI98905.1 indole-3-glycerol phosphate synthase [Thermococcus celer Vu 13 = JCM 8558]